MGGLPGRPLNDRKARQTCPGKEITSIHGLIGGGYGRRCNERAAKTTQVHMELYQIRYFLAVAETLNFTRASERCFVSQPALTKAIQRLE
jgi:hypothetical protein